MTKNKKFHLIGICGKGMSALALLLKQRGFRVSGSDDDFYDPIYSLLKRNKILFSSGYSPDNITDDTDVIVIGKHAGLVPEDLPAQAGNEEVKAAFASGIAVKSLPEVLGGMIKQGENTVIAGSFGKSTTAALLAWCLESSGKNPSYFIGAVPTQLKTNAKWRAGGRNRQFILEGDEYPSANWDNTSKFLYFHPKNLILISGEHDHINVFPKEKDYLLPYKKLVALLPLNGLLIASKMGKNVSKIIKGAKCKVVTYGLNNKAKWYPKKIIPGEQTTFELWKQDKKKSKKVATLETGLLGSHNIENIVGVSAFLLEKKLINVKQLEKAVYTFRGILGRLDLKTEKSSVLVYEGFGSSYSKAKSIFEALKLHFPKKKIITIFEPHTFGWRNKEAKKWYRDVFDTSSVVILLPPPEHGAKTHDQITFSEIVKEVKKNNKNTYPAKNEKEVLALLRKITEKDDIVALITSGSLFGLTTSVPKLMEKMFPKKKK